MTQPYDLIETPDYWKAVDDIARNHRIYGTTFGYSEEMRLYEHHPNAVYTSGADVDWGTMRLRGE